MHRVVKVWAFNLYAMAISYGGLVAKKLDKTQESWAGQLTLSTFITTFCCKKLRALVNTSVSAIERLKSYRKKGSIAVSRIARCTPGSHSVFLMPKNFWGHPMTWNPTKFNPFWKRCLSMTKECWLAGCKNYRVWEHQQRSWGFQDLKCV